MRSGFSIVRNGDSLGYPWRESLRSLAPLVDEIVVAHGDSTDTTLASLEILAKELPCPLRILNSPWDPANTKGGSELARQSNIALAACAHEICVYIQGDEVLHEKEYTQLRADLERFEKDEDVDGLTLEWIHFYGTFENVVRSRRWYRREVRAVKKSRGLQSYGDAQGFRIPTGDGKWTKPRTALSTAHCLHYGWVRPPEVMARKSQALDRLWHGSARDGTHDPKGAFPPHFGMHRYQGSHPQVMRARIEAFHKDFPNYNPFAGAEVPRDGKYWSLKLTDLVESLTGWRPGEFKNYRLVKIYR